MKTPIAGSSDLPAPASAPPLSIRQGLLVCGIASSLLYAAMDVIGGTRWQNYSWMSMEFSRLSALGAPSRPIHLVLNPIYTLLVVAFGLGIWWSAGEKLARRVVGGALIVYGLVSFTWPQFFPEDLTAPVSAFTNTMHILIAAATVISWMLILGFGATAFGKRFRLYSIGTLLTVLLFGGVLITPQAGAMAAGQPTPWLGLTERINLYSFMLWVVVLAITLLRSPMEQPQSDSLGLKERKGTVHPGVAANRL